MVQNVHMNAYFDISQKLNFAKNITYDLIAFSQRFVYVSPVTNRGFALPGTHLYGHDFVPLPGFLFVWRGTEKSNKKRLNFWYTSPNDLKFPSSVCANIFVTVL